MPYTKKLSSVLGLTVGPAPYFKNNDYYVSPVEKPFFSYKKVPETLSIMRIIAKETGYSYYKLLKNFLSVVVTDKIIEGRKKRALSSTRLRINALLSDRVEAYGKKHFSWEEWREVAQKTSDINYGCSNCKNRTFDKRACCKSCAINLGYHSAVEIGEHRDMLIDYFDPINGYWRENVGCIIPRKYRSPTCLAYSCDNMNKTKANILYNYMCGKELSQKARYILFNGKT